MDMNETKQKAKLNGSLPADQMTKRELIAMEIYASVQSSRIIHIDVDYFKSACIKADALLNALEETK